MRSLYREPLVHFLAIGAAIFAAHWWFVRGAGEAGEAKDRVVRITAQDVAWLTESWARQRQRPPSDAEKRGLVSDYLKELLLAREAVELGLDANDTLIRRRLAQKMEFLVQDAARAAEPGDEVLAAYYQANRQRFDPTPRIWFEQVFFTGDDAAARAAAALESLAHLPDPAGQVDRTLLPPTFAGEDRAAVGRLLGDDFAQRVFELAPGTWQGPIASGYGVHLVKVTRLEAPAGSDFAAVRDRVLEAWYAQQQDAADRQYFAALMEKYDVVVDEDIKPLLSPQAGPLAQKPGDTAP